MLRTSLFGLVALLTLTPGGPELSALQQEPRSVREYVAELDAVDATVRARAACGLRELGDRSADAIPALLKLLADGSPVDGGTCGRRWSRGGPADPTTPGEEAAAELAAPRSRAA